jgi:hypothetical protein
MLSLSSSQFDPMADITLRHPGQPDCSLTTNAFVKPSRSVPLDKSSTSRRRDRVLDPAPAISSACLTPWAPKIIIGALFLRRAHMTIGSHTASLRTAINKSGETE